MQLNPNLGDQAVATVYAASVQFTGAMMHLYQNNLVVGQLTKIADLTEASFTGYAPQAATVLTSGVDSAGDFTTVIAPLTFTAGIGLASPQTVYGWYITDAAGTTLLFAGTFPANFTFTNPGDALVLKSLLNWTLSTDQEVEGFHVP